MFEIKNMGEDTGYQELNLESVIDMSNDFKETVIDIEHLNTVTEVLATNLEDDGITINYLNDIADVIKILGNRHDIDTSLLSNQYEDKEIALKMINLEGMAILSKLKDKLFSKAKSAMEGMSDFNKRFVQSFKGKSQLDIIENVFKNSIKHTLTLKDSDVKFVERSFRSMMTINKLDSITSLVSFLQKPTGHSQDVFKTFDALRPVSVKDISKKEIRDIIWKHISLNKMDLNAVDFIYKDSSFDKSDIQGIKDRSIKPFLGTPYKDKALIVMAGAVEVSLKDKLLEIKRVTKQNILTFKEQKEFKNVLDVSVARKLASSLSKDLEGTTKELEKLMKYQFDSLVNKEYMDRKDIINDLYMLAFNSIIDRFATLKDITIVLDKASDVA